MNDLTLGQPTMGSFEIATLVQKRHDNVKRAIESLADKELITLPQIEETSFFDEIGKRQKTTEYRLNERDSYIVVAQLSPEFTARLVDRWRELEASVGSRSVTDERVLLIEQKIDELTDSETERNLKVLNEIRLVKSDRKFLKTIEKQSRDTSDMIRVFLMRDKSSKVIELLSQIKEVLFKDKN